jgi:rod shape-determining protein MreC
MLGQRGFLIRLLLLWLLLEALAAAQVRREGGSTVLGDWLTTAARPGVAVCSWLARGASDLTLGLGDYRQLVIRYQRLRLEREQLEARNLLLEEDMAAMEETMGLPHVGIRLEADSIVTRCTFRNLGQGRMQISAGRVEEVVPSSAVLGPHGLVGRVVRSRARSSWVELLTHPAAAVAIRSEDGAVEGLASGTGSDELRVEFIPRRAQLLRGTLLVSSGADGIFPPGLAVARVRTVRETEGPFLEVRAAPTAHLATLRTVVVLPQVAQWPEGSRPR